MMNHVKFDESSIMTKKIANRQNKIDLKLNDIETNNKCKNCFYQN